MPPPGQLELAARGNGVLCLFIVALMLMVTPAFSGCPFRHGLRFAAPGSRGHVAPSVAGLPDPPAATASGARTTTSPSSHGSNVTNSRRLKYLVGLGVATRLDQQLANDVQNTISRATSMPRATLATTPYPSTPYGPNDKPTSPIPKDWASVVSACKAVGQLELRMNNFWIRSVFHDGGACIVDCPTCRDLDTTAVLNSSEIVRPEDPYESLAATASRAVLKIARRYKVSAADALAVCAAVATETLGGPKVLGKANMLQVGRVDGSQATALTQLPANDMNVDAFVAWWTARGFSVAEAVALMGAHGLIDSQGCYRGRGGNPRDFCNPFQEPCGDIRMFSWKNHYYVDAFTPAVRVVPNSELPELPTYDQATEADTIRIDTTDEFRADLRKEICKWTSPEKRGLAQEAVLAIRRGKAVGLPPKGTATAFWDAAYRQCMASDLTAIHPNCNHPQTWFYTVTDAYLATACQASSSGLSPAALSVKQAMQRYLDGAVWNADYVTAFHKLVNTYPTIRKNPRNGSPYLITGTECATGYVCDDKNLKTDDVCTARACPLNVARPDTCHPCCKCKTLFTADRALSLSSGGEVELPKTPGSATPTPWIPPSDATVGPTLPEVEHADRIMAPDVAPTSMPAPGSNEAPRSPYGGPDICPTADGRPYEVGGYPGSPYLAKPFQVTYDRSVQEPLQPNHTCCRDAAVTPLKSAPHCLVTYTLDVVDFPARPWDETLPGCAAQPPTQLLGYGGRVPGPTIQAPAGHEVMVRYINKISETALGGKQHWPCVGARRGRPISQHLHGSASLAPYDGWADDVTCAGESKDYVYPNQRPTTAWYHDHGIHVTGDNAYHGLAGWYIISSKQKHGSCGEPYNLEHIPERLLMLSDKVLDSKCQLYNNHEGPHRNNLYGDINMVNGQPWPKMPLGAGWYRFRFLNAAMARPYLIKIKDSKGADVAQDICHVIAADGGYRARSVPFPVEGLQIGVSERYEVVCNFESFAGQTLYLWNGRNDAMFKAVPYFCYSHLVARIQVAPKAARPQSPDDSLPAVPPPAPAPDQPPAAPTDPAPATAPPPPPDATVPGEDAGSAPGRRMLLAAMRAQAAAATTAATTATAATASAEAVEVDDSTSAEFDASDKPKMPLALNKVLNESDIAAARDLISQGKPHRTFKFGRRNGHWVINGETWDSAKIAADDVGHNTWELWLLRTGGGWFHPIHMHLVDFYILKRGKAEGDDGLFAYEREAPKDVVYLGASQWIWVIARFGAHRGSYMFHCHNLVHEDYDMLRAMSIMAGTGTAATGTAPTSRNAGSQITTLTTVSGVLYDVYGDPMTGDAAATPSRGPMTADYCKAVLDKNMYRIYYPTSNDPQYDLLHSAANPWWAPVCPLGA